MCLRSLSWPALAGLVLLAAAGSTRPSAAARPESADTALVQLGSGEGGTRAFVAYPPGKDSAPAVIVAFEWWGLNEQIRGLARRLAHDAGAVVIVPDLYHGKVPGDAEQAHVLMRGLEAPVAMTDFDAAEAWLRRAPRVSHEPIAVMGFCMGGGVALGYGMHDSTVAGVVMFYGFPETDPTKLATLHAPVLAHFGEKDDGIPAAKVESFRDAMKQAGRPLDVYSYADAGHAFMNEKRPSYAPAAAKLAWQRTLDFLRTTLHPH